MGDCEEGIEVKDTITDFRPSRIGEPKGMTV